MLLLPMEGRAEGVDESSVEMYSSRRWERWGRGLVVEVEERVGVGMEVGVMRGGR